MDRNLVLSVIVLGIMVALATLILADLYNRDSNEETIAGIKFISDSGRPSLRLSELSEKETFVITPAFTPEASTINSKMADVITRSNMVLPFVGKETLIAARIIGDGELQGCYTNEGSYTEGKEISPEECLPILNNENYAVLKVSMPSEGVPTVLISGNTIEINPSDESGISSVTHAVLRALFGRSADEAIDAANKKSDIIGK
jgi:hypothetical protein